MSLPVLRDVSEPEAFWASLSPAQQFALLSAAPKKLAGPRRRVEGDRASWRHDAYGQQVSGSYACLCDTCAKDTGKHLNEANVDARLVAAGWTLVPAGPTTRVATHNEQFDKPSDENV